MLSLPLGGPHKERGLALATASSAIRAFLRPEAAEPVPVSATSETRATAALPDPVPAPIGAKPVQREIAKRDSSDAGTPSPARTAAIPATFFDPSRLTEPPRPLDEPPVHLLLPMMARPGVANLVLYIDEAGTVTQVEIDSSTLPPAINERAAALFGAVRFSPGRIDGTAVKTRVRITFGAEERAKQN